MTYEQLKERAYGVLLKMLDDHAKAPVRGTYNNLLGKYGTSQRDVIKSATNQLQLLNKVSNMLHNKDVVTFVDDSAELPRITIND